MNSLISVHNLTLSFRANVVLKEISFVVNEGEYIAVTGENGSGKSTLIKAILNIIRIDSGSVKLFGHTHDTFKKWFMIGYVPQITTSDSIGLPFTVEEVIKSGFLPASGVNFVDSLEQVYKLTGISHYANVLMSELSGGFRQRVMIARALINRPKLLILDEPTSGVDLENRLSLVDFFAKINKEEGITIIHITHEVESIAQKCDRVLCIEKTELCQSKTQQEHIHLG